MSRIGFATHEMRFVLENIVIVFFSLVCLVLILLVRVLGAKPYFILFNPDLIGYYFIFSILFIYFIYKWTSKIAFIYFIFTVTLVSHITIRKINNSYDQDTRSFNL